MFGSVQPGQKLDHYFIESELARSGMATIFRGTDSRNGRQVVVKVPHVEAESDVVFFERFRREKKIGQRLEHPGIAKVFRDDGQSQLYIVMEWAEGTMLRTLLHEQHSLPASRAVRIALRICEALEYIHSHGVVHRDLKPENIIVDADDNIKLIDFGIAGEAGSRRLTFGKFSNTMGSPDYISPEQVRGKRGDARSDVFALGVMLYEMLTGRAPFDGPSPLAIMNSRLLNDPVPPRTIDPSISFQLQEIIRHAMERDPDKRYPTAKDLAYDLEHQDATKMVESPEMPESTSRKILWHRSIFSFAPLALIPLLIFTLLFFMTRHL
jgi:eukaryotic-like serine/threonine-protein kinase